LLVLVSFRKNLEQVDDTASKQMSEEKQRSNTNNTPRTFPVVSSLERFERVLVKQETCPSWMRFGNHCIFHEQQRGAVRFQHVDYSFPHGPSRHHSHEVRKCPTTATLPTFSFPLMATTTTKHETRAL
jgi:hypothetical protein